MENSLIISETNPKSPVAEAYRILRSNLQFSSINKEYKKLQITSSGPSEGKSTTVANLGTVMAQAGAKVIIVDCDLRRAVQHQIFGLANVAGLTNVLVGGQELDQVIQQTKLPNLQVLTSGPLPPNPAELLGSPKAREVLEAVAAKADIVLIDSPPVLMVADAPIISSIVDGTIMVIKSAKTKIEAVKQAKERLDKANATIVGTVLNAVESSHGSYYYYDSYYYGDNTQKQIASTKF